jgi:CRISPR-associated endonuclease/helicase Cas3
MKIADPGGSKRTNGNEHAPHERPEMTYWAHSDPDKRPPGHADAKWQPLSDHLQNVAEIAALLAGSARPGDESLLSAARTAGLLHDLGKYTDCFQNMILTGKGRCQHSAHGAVIAAYGCRRMDVAHAIAGHHGGIPDRDNDGGTRSLQVRLKETRAEAESLQARAAPGLSALFVPAAGPKMPVTSDNFDLHTRMLFSCLVDADRLDSSHQAPLFPPMNAEDRLAALLASIEQLAAKAPEGVVKEARRQVLEDCLNAASCPEKLLSLTVPTGGGKTLSAMAFALKRASLFPGLYRRVIVVIPYLSIIEQNADVYAGVFGHDAILEHHSGSFDRLRPNDDDHFVPDSPDKDETYTPAARRPATENWSAPLIVTTSVRFFESLFSNRPSDLRRVHSIARSIVILDEVQTLPRRLIAPLLTMIRELSDQWGCTFVFSTATQPAFQKPPGSPAQDPRLPTGTIREIVREPDRLHTVLKRVTIDWELDRAVSWEEIADRIMHPSNSSSLCVVNLREHASVLFDAVLAKAGNDSPEAIFHLSTRMCAAHRLVILNRIKRRLKERLPCRVISTQLIEAGVDLDFDVVFRALGPLDSVLQAAGRADREGLATARLGQPAGRVIVFRSPDEKTPPNEYREATDITRVMAKNALQRGQPLQTDSTEQMTRYWNRYFTEGDDLGTPLQKLRLEAKFATLADKFEMISNRTLDVFVPYDDAGRSAIQELRETGLLNKLMRAKLQRYTVGLRPYELEKARGVLEEIRKDSGIWVAVERAYTERKGLKLELSAEDNFI